MDSGVTWDFKSAWLRLAIEGGCGKVKSKGEVKDEF